MAAGKEPLFVLEEQIEGIDIRAFVVGRRVAAAATRLPAYVVGVDLMTPDLCSADGAVVLETNGPANIRVHHCPAYGRPQDVAGAIVDEMIATAGAPPRLISLVGKMWAQH